jgi:hypothetical protein
LPIAVRGARPTAGALSPRAALGSRCAARQGADLIDYIHHLEEQLQKVRGALTARQEGEAERDAIIAQLRCCTDPHCVMCASCVTALQVRLKPAPPTIQRKYVEAPWRREPVTID